LKSNKALRTILIVTLGAFVVQFLNYFIQLCSFVFKPQNPLIPKYIWKYAAFNLSIMSFVMFICALYTFYIMRNTERSPAIIYVLFFIAVSVCFFGAHLYQFIDSFNPYAY
jgi:hypothetical protein